MEIWTQVIHRNCSCISELDVRLSNHPNWTTIAQVMVHFIPGTIAALFRPYTLSRIWDWFSVGKNRKFGLVFFMEVVDSSVKLMLGF